MTQVELFTELATLNLPIDRYVVVGGSALAARGIRECGDVDLIVQPELYRELLINGWEEFEKKPGFNHIRKGECESAQDFSHIGNSNLVAAEVIARAEHINGFPIMSLEDLVLLKTTMNRPKDHDDLKLIHDFQSSTI